MKSLETRVGFMALDILRLQTEDYVRAHVDKHGKYVGNPYYLRQLKTLYEVLN